MQALPFNRVNQPAYFTEMENRASTIPIIVGDGTIAAQGQANNQD